MISEQANELIRQKIRVLYPDRIEEAEAKLFAWLNAEPLLRPVCDSVNETDVVLITYGDSLRREGATPLRALRDFLGTRAKDTINTVHLLPIYPWTSDDGFSVSDYRAVDPTLGTWADVEALAEDYSLMLDAVVNHASVSGGWFRKFLACEEPYRDYFVSVDPAFDTGAVIRPRTSPLLTPFETRDGIRQVWTTFSADQADLNYHSVDLLIEILDVLLFYARKGARFLRLDAIGFAWKKSGTSCLNLPETHELVRLMRLALDIRAPLTLPVTETNVPHAENVRYFGGGREGEKEAAMVYQFPLPPLTLHSFLSGDASKLCAWLAGLEAPEAGNAFFNFLASHDGIGLRPVEGILDEREVACLTDACLRHGGRISYRNNEDGTQTPYELNISWFDALSGDGDPEELRIGKFLAAHCLLLSLAGVPGIYIHSLLGSRNDVAGMEASGINRRINREKLNVERLLEELENAPIRREVFRGLVGMIRLRRQQPAFSPRARQEVLRIDPRAVCLLRTDEGSGQRVLVAIGVSKESLTLHTPRVAGGTDLFTGERVGETTELKPYGYRWIRY